MLEERQRFYDMLLIKVLQMDNVAECLEENKRDLWFRDDYSREDSALSVFYDDTDAMLCTPEIWEMIKKEIISDINFITYDGPERFIKDDGRSWKMEDLIQKQLGYVQEELNAALKRKHQVAVLVPLQVA